MNKPVYDLEDRTLRYAQRASNYVKSLPKSVSNFENGKQLIRASGSTGANYIETNEALSKKDFGMRIKIARKEAKESRYWLNLTEPLPAFKTDKEQLIREATELIKILSAILIKSNIFKF